MPVESASAASRRTMLLGGVALMLTALHGGCATDPDDIEDAAATALHQLLAQNETARSLAQNARAILTFPVIKRAGLIFGGLDGKGVLQVGGQPAGYYQTGGVTFGLQAGAKQYSLALFFMDDQALDYLRRSAGWEIGTGPTVVVVDQGVSRQFTTTTMRRGIYAFIWGQSGLMAGVGLQGTRITPMRV